MRTFRSRPTGWRNESYRHYLAAKGVKTARYYAVRDYAKGQRRLPPELYRSAGLDPQTEDLARYRAKGYSDAEYASQSPAHRRLIQLKNMVKKKKRSDIPDALGISSAASYESATPISIGFESLESAPLPPDSSQQFAPIVERPVGPQEQMPMNEQFSPPAEQEAEAPREVDYSVVQSDFEKVPKLATPGVPPLNGGFDDL
jgi:hypothetical protein